MKQSSVLLITVLFASLLAGAIQLRTDLVARYEIDEVPNFFFKVHPDGNLIAYNHSYNNARGKNELMILDSGKTISLPGPFDPVFIPYTPLMVIPENSSDIHYNFYKVSAERGTIEKIKSDWSLNGFYQSVGILEQNANRVDFRVIVEGRMGLHKFRDYRYDIQSEKVSELGSTKTLCRGIDLKLPMLSKDGRELGAIDVSRSKTTIFSIQSDGRCTRKLRLPHKTGKVNFSWDGKLLTYHIYDTKNLSVTDNWVVAPSSAYVADIFIYDRSEERTFRLTNNIDSNSLYPDFLKNGDIFFVDHPHGRNDSVSFLQVSPETSRKDVILAGNWLSPTLHPTRKVGGEGFLFNFEQSDRVRRLILRAENGRVRIHQLEISPRSGPQPGQKLKLSVDQFVPRDGELAITLPLWVQPEELYVRAEGYDDNEVQLVLELTDDMNFEEFDDSGQWSHSVSPSRRRGGEHLTYYFNGDTVENLILNAQNGRVEIHELYYLDFEGRRIDIDHERFIRPDTPTSFDIPSAVSELHIQAEGYDNDAVELLITMSSVRTVSFVEVREIFQSHSCIGCHLDLDQESTIPESWLSGGEDSILYRSVKDDMMPLNGDYLSEEDKARVLEWLVNR